MTVCRVGDYHLCPDDSHKCIGCPHVVTGPATYGAPDVILNGRSILRSNMVDGGIHCCCCGPNTWQTLSGSSDVFVHGIPIVRLGDITKSCGGIGSMITSSEDTNNNH